MMNPDEIRAGLQKVGLNSYEAQAYTTLLEHGALPAVEVAKRSSMPGSRVYDILADLEQDGYIETFERESKRHARATEPSAVVDGLRCTSEHLSDAAESIEDAWEQSQLPNHRLVLFDEVDTILDHAASLVRDADVSVSVAATPSQYYQLRDAMREAHERDVDIRVSLEGVDDDRIESDQPTTEIRHRPIPGPFVAIVDRTHTCFAPNERAPTTYGIVLDDSILSFVFHWYFQTCLWAVCDPVYRTPNATFQYVSIEAFVRDVFSVWRDGAILPVTISGIDIETGERRTETGVITGIAYPNMDLTTADPPTYGDLAGHLTLALVNDDGRHLVGGWSAVYEDIETEHIVLHGADIVMPS